MIRLFKSIPYISSVTKILIRRSSTSIEEMCGSTAGKKGLIIGAYDASDSCNHPPELTTDGNKFDSSVENKISRLLTGLPIRNGKVHVFTNVSPKYNEVAVVGIGKKGIKRIDELEQMDMIKENIRVATGVGAHILQKHGMDEIIVDSCGDPEAAAEGSYLGAWQYQENKNDEDKLKESKIELLDGDKEQWDRGVLKAESQNVARCLCQMPANLLTPTLFARRCIDILCPYGIQVYVRDRKWMESKRMHAMLAAAKGSCEPPIFLQLDYCGANIHEKPSALIGKGTTFSSGGLCLKDCEGMSEYRAEMSGAACVVAVFKAIAAMRLPINVQGIIPLFEHMLSGMAMKPGDVVVSQSGKVMRDEMTDNYSRFALTDAIAFAAVLRPDLIMNIATMSEGTKFALGGGPSAVFSTYERIWTQLAKAGSYTGDRFWKLPMYKEYKHLVTDYLNCDVNNVGKGIGGGACLGAAFLMEFAPSTIPFVHIDTAGTGMLANGYIPYLKNGLMSGRPTRSIIQFLCNKAYDCDKKEITSPHPEDCFDEFDQPQFNYK